jgi:hypothetical protein
MPVVNNIFDSTGAMPVGTSNIVVGGVTYIVNKEAITPKWNTAADDTGAGLPNRKRWARDRWQYEGEWQLATDTTAYPAPGSTFQRTPPSIVTAVNFVITVTPFEPSNQPTDIRVIKVTAEEYINSITTS